VLRFDFNVARYTLHGDLSARAKIQEDRMKPDRCKVIGAIDGITVQG